MSAGKGSKQPALPEPDDTAETPGSQREAEFSVSTRPARRPKRLSTVRLESEIVDRFKASGPGWQVRINEALREWLANC